MILRTFYGRLDSCKILRQPALTNLRKHLFTPYYMLQQKKKNSEHTFFCAKLNTNAIFTVALCQHSLSKKLSLSFNSLCCFVLMNLYIYMLNTFHCHKIMVTKKATNDNEGEWQKTGFGCTNRLHFEEINFIQDIQK